MRRWMLLLAVSALAVLGLWGSSALAHGPGEEASPGQPGWTDRFYERVASELGRDPEEVRRAFGRALREEWLARLDRAISRRMEEGRMTREQAESLRRWLARRPEVPFDPFRPYVRPSLQRVAEQLGVDLPALREAVARARRAVEEERMARWLDRQVEAGRLTPEEADALLEWFRSRPEGLPGLGSLFRSYPYPFHHPWGHPWEPEWAGPHCP